MDPKMSFLCSFDPLLPVFELGGKLEHLQKIHTVLKQNMQTSHKEVIVVLKLKPTAAIDQTDKKQNTLVQLNALQRKE